VTADEPLEQHVADVTPGEPAARMLGRSDVLVDSAAAVPEPRKMRGQALDDRTKATPA
jgi:hypothetical protein